MYAEIDKLRVYMWEAYFIGALGSLYCDSCSTSEDGVQLPDVQMSPACRECHYALEDLINTDYADGLHGMTSRCLSFDRGIHNFDRDVYGVLNAEAQALVDQETADKEQAEEYYGTTGQIDV